MKNFLIVGTQRTGSTVIAESIRYHPRIVSGGEWTKPAPVHRKLSITKRVFAADLSVLPQRQRDHVAGIMNARIEWFGFRVLFRSSDKWLVHPGLASAIWLDRLEGHIKWLRRRPDTFVIHIIRCDNLAWLRSKSVSRASKLYIGKPYPKGIRVTIPVREAKARVQSKDWVDSRLSSLAGTNPYLNVYYEDFLAKPNEVVVSMLRFLHCDPGEVPSHEQRLKRQSSERIDDQILNYRELVEVLEKNKMRWSRSCDLNRSEAQ